MRFAAALRWAVLAVALCGVLYGLARLIWFYGDAGVAEEATGIIFFSGMLSLIVGLPVVRHRTRVGLLVLLGSIGSVALSVYSVDLAILAAVLVLYGVACPFHDRSREMYVALLVGGARLGSAFRSIPFRLRLLLAGLGRAAPPLPRVPPRRGVGGLRIPRRTLSRLFAPVAEVSLCVIKGLYSARVMMLLTVYAILFSSVLLGPRLGSWGWRREYVVNGGFDQGFEGWTIPKMRYHDEFISNEHWYLPEKSCLTLSVSSRRGLSYDRLAVSQPLDVELGPGLWWVGGYMGNVDVYRECEVLATSIAVKLRDSTGGVRSIMYAVLVESGLTSTSVEAVIGVGRGRDVQVSFSRNLVNDIRDVWNVPFVVGWRVTGVELLVEFRNNWGDALHLEAVFDGIFLRQEFNLSWLNWLAGSMLVWLPVMCIPIAGLASCLRGDWFK